jgi:hypothetical protein
MSRDGGSSHSLFPLLFAITFGCVSDIDVHIDNDMEKGESCRFSWALGSEAFKEARGARGLNRHEKSSLTHR